MSIDRDVLIEGAAAMQKQRIEDGKFGDCLKCGEPIAQRRLEADPTYRLCINCA